jgi:hypothetical protein
MIGAQCAGTVIVQEMQAHEATIKIFRERVEANQTLGIPDSCDIVALQLAKAEKLLERLRICLVQPLPIRHDPIIIATG